MKKGEIYEGTVERIEFPNKGVVMIEAATHMAVAAAVSGGDADAGMGIQSAARAMGLDFIEIGREEYDFAIPVRFLDFPPVQHFLAVLKSREFAERVEKLGGYGLARTGEILYL